MMLRRVGNKISGLAALLGLMMSGLASVSVADTSPSVVVSIKPIHSLVAGVMQGVGTPSLLVTGAGSPHTYSLKPSQAEALQQADVIFWVGPGLETFLKKPVETLGLNAVSVALLQSPGVSVLPPRDKHDFGEAHHNEDHDAGHDDDDHKKGHDHEEEHNHEEGHDHGGVDPHIWLDPQNAIALVQAIAATLAERDPAHAVQYQANAKSLESRIVVLDKTLSVALAPIADQPFAVFHDAYHYFEDHYGLHAVGMLTLNPESNPSAERVQALQETLSTSGARCIFSEPQFPSKLVSIVTNDSGIASGVLDPLGAALTPGTDLYFTLMQDIADGLRGCLSATK
ncbi:zinc ABC transporter substrate-binding protein [Hwanghaeella sp. LZ110]|uniref:zinc ABC transporter substrate-binding protein n=1 Tax=Hwanghaeella sp. LZ110 TaxID=3402810 RepID=UPI003B672EFD